MEQVAQDAGGSLEWIVGFEDFVEIPGLEIDD